MAPKDRLPADRTAFRSKLRKGASHRYLYVTLLGLKTDDPLEISERILRGLPYGALECFQKNIDLPLTQLAVLIQIPLRTLSRRKEEGRLQPDESDRLVRLSRIVAKAVELFEGDFDAAKRWLLAPLRSLRGRAPLELAATEVGAREVEALIGRLEHGIIS